VDRTVITGFEQTVCYKCSNGFQEINFDNYKVKVRPADCQISNLITATDAIGRQPTGIPYSIPYSEFKDWY